MNKYSISVFDNVASYHMNSVNAPLVDERGKILFSKELEPIVESDIYPLKFLIMHNNVGLCCDKFLWNKGKDGSIVNLNENKSFNVNIKVCKSSNTQCENCKKHEKCKQRKQSIKYRRLDTAKFYNLTCLLNEIFSLHDQLFWYYKQYKPYNLHRREIDDIICDLGTLQSKPSYIINSDAIILLSAIRINEALLSFNFKYLYDKLIKRIRSVDKYYDDVFNTIYEKPKEPDGKENSKNKNSRNKDTYKNVSNIFRSLRNKYVHRSQKGFIADGLVNSVPIWLDCDVIDFLYSEWFKLLQDDNQIGTSALRGSLFNVDINKSSTNFNNEEYLIDFTKTITNDKHKEFIEGVLECLKQLRYVEVSN